MDHERDPDAQGPEHGDEHGPGGAVLHDADLGMALRVQVIGQRLDRGVDQLRREHPADSTFKAPALPQRTSLTSLTGLASKNRTSTKADYAARLSIASNSLGGR